VRLIATLPPQKETPAMLEGTEAHEWCEWMLKEGERDMADKIGLTMDARIGRKRVDKEFADAINVYLNHVYAKADKPGAELNVERRFHLTEIDDEFFGTNDASVYVPSERTLYVDDYKHGAGVAVDAEDNDQLYYYAYGGWTAYRDAGVDKIVCSIVQPRAPGEPIKTVELTEFDLVDWSFAVAEDAKRTREPDAPLVPGAWCINTFCPARHTCPALKAKADAALADGFAAVPDLEAACVRGDDLGSRLANLPLLKTYIKAVETHAENEAAAGRMPEGFKWVLGRGSREWHPEKSENEIAQEITRISNACNPWVKSLISVAQAEKAIGKKPFEALKSIVKKRDGKPTLAPVSDKRAAWQGDTSGFAAIEESEDDESE